MGQKVNPLIYRLGTLNNQWKSKFNSKNLEELSLHNFQTVEIVKYLNQFFNEIGLLMHDYKIHYSQKYLYLYVSYFLTSKVLISIKKVKLKRTRIKIEKTKDKTDVFYKSKFKIYKKYERFMQINKFRYRTVIDKNSFLEQILQSFTLFLSKKLNIILIFQHVRKGLSLNANALNEFKKKITKNKFMTLRKYSKDSLFKDLFNVLIVCFTLKNSASILTDFISQKLEKLKKHNQFFYLLKSIITSLQRTKISRIKGIKIKVKGRLNGKPRTASKIITVGPVPVQTLTTKIDYAESTSFTINGTLGVKVWIATI